MEAAALVSDGEFRTAVVGWFNDLWSSAYDVTEADLKRIRSLWSRRQRTRAKEREDSRRKEAEGSRRKVLNVLDGKGVLLNRWKNVQNGDEIWGETGIGQIQAATSFVYFKALTAYLFLAVRY